MRPKMAGDNWMVMCVLLLICSRVGVSRALFFELPRQSQLWSAYVSLTESDCNGRGKTVRFPHVYGSENAVSTVIGAPENLTTLYIFKEYYRDGMLFPGIVIEFSPPQHGSGSVTGYEITLTKVDGIMCIVLDLEDVPQSQQTNIQIELYPLSSETYFRIHAVSLPNLNDEVQRSRESRIMTGKDGRLHPPVYWVASVTYDITQHGEEKWLEVVFSSPPPQFRFRRFEVALLPADNREAGIQIVTTETCHYTFKNVTLGQYKLQIRPVDDYFSMQGQCLCHYRHGACSTCFTTEVQTFTVS